MSAVFKLDTSGNFTVLANIPGGAYAYAGLVRDAAGNLYGTTTYGGDLSCNVGGGEPGCGVVYKVDTAGNYTVMHAFTGGSDGANPTYANLAIDAAGNLYGVTQYGGAGVSCTYTQCGTVFRIDPSGHETVLHRFNGTDGYQPQGVNVNPAGGVYGTTYQGGAYGCGDVFKGDVFKIDGSGQFTVLYSFTSTNGCTPNAGLVFDPSGAYFGTFNYYQDDPGIEQWTGGGIFRLKTQ